MDLESRARPESGPDPRELKLYKPEGVGYRENVLQVLHRPVFAVLPTAGLPGQAQSKEGLLHGKYSKIISYEYKKKDVATDAATDARIENVSAHFDLSLEA